jgi:hypothetical protein
VNPGETLTETPDFRPRTTAGQRLAAARRASGLSQKGLASRLGISLWKVEELERGNGDTETRARALASMGLRPAPEPMSPPGAVAVDLDHDGEHFTRIRSATDHETGRYLVLGSIALLVLIRFFTEVIPILPRAANFIDVPILVVLGIAAAVQPQSSARARPLSFALPALLFLLLCVASVVLNPSRVASGPVLVFIYGFLAPIGIYAAVVRLWPAGHASKLSRLVVALGIVQLFVVFAFDLPLFLSSSNPDVISGTFGTNAYQLVFFLLVFTALLAGIFVVEKARLAARFAPLLFVLTLWAIFLAQYRALLVTTAVSIVVIGILLRAKGRGILGGTFVVVSFVIALSYVASSFPGLRLPSTLAALRESPGFFVSERLRSAGTFLQLYEDEPFAMLTGSGPGTFSSRGWQTFANASSGSRSNVAGGYVSSVTGGTAYRTDVSDEYVLPRLRSGTVIEGSKAVTSPYSSYSSLLAEVGLLGFLLIVGIYFRALVHAWTMTVREVRFGRPGDPLPALFLASTVAFSILLQMAFLENWLEVTRVTFLAWVLFAVATKELHARNESTA